MARRHQVVDVLVAARPLLNEIAYRALEKKSLAGTGRGLAVTPAGPLTGGEVGEDGVILVRGSVDGYPVEVGFRPMLADGAFEWRCRGLRVVEGWFVPRDGYFPGACPRASAESPF